MALLTTEALPDRPTVDAVVEPVPAPRPGLELLGEYRGSGSTQPPHLVRRADGQVVQLSRLTYLVVAAVDGHRDAEGIAAVVSAQTGRELDADGARYLLAEKLAPLGLVDLPGSTAPAPTADPLLALRTRGTLVGARATNAVAAALGPLFRLPVVVASVSVLVLFDVWLFLLHGLVGPLRDVLVSPSTLLLVFGISLVAALFHEFGHATACRYGGARPGVIGVGVYIVWPAFFTNVTDSYRLGRAGRLRTDLGGLYFHALFIMGLGGLYAATGAPWLLLAIAFIHAEMLEQLMPFVRFDGYFVLSDIVGIPDLFAKMSPIVASALRRRRHDAAVGDLKRWVRAVVTLWVVVVLPIMVINIGALVVDLPRLARALARGAAQHGHDAAHALGAGRVAVAALDAVDVVMLLLSLVGTSYLLLGLGHRGLSAARTWSAGRPGRRRVALTAGGVLAAALAATWAVEIAGMAG